MAHFNSGISEEGSTDSSCADLEKRVTDSSIEDLEERSASSENRTLKGQVIDLYRRFKQLLNSDDFETNFKEDLQKSSPDYIQSIERRMRDMDRCDHGIVITGETSAGKSTLINMILGKSIFVPRNEESTSTICKIRNSEKLKIIIESKTGQKTEKALPDKCNSSTPEGLKELKKALVNLTEVTFAEESKQYRSVDIGFPIPMLKGNTILVDTPGIGPDEERTQKLMEYLPNAVSLIFVITVGNAGGMQKDRLPEILRKVCFQMIDEMPCLDPEDAIFVTNKWDTVKRVKTAGDESDSEDERDKDRTWHNVKSRIQERWPAVKDENIFQLSLWEVSEDGENFSSQQFREFRKKLNVNIEKADNIRVLRHLSFLQELLLTVEGGLNARLRFSELESGLQAALLYFQQEKIDKLTEENHKAHASLHERITSTIENTVTICHTYMTSEEGKEAILNPPERIPILNDSWNPFDFYKKVDERACLYMEKFLKSQDVQSKFLSIQKELFLYTKKACVQLSEIESTYLGLGNATLEMFFSVWDFSDVNRFVKMLHDEEFGAFGLSFGIFFNIGFAVTAWAFLPLSVPIMLLMDRESRKKKIIEEEYTKLMSSFPDKIRNHLNSTCGKLLREMVNKVTEDFLPRRIDHLTELVRQLVAYREDNRQKRDLFLRLLQQIKSIEESAANIRRDLLRLD